MKRRLRQIILLAFVLILMAVSSAEMQPGSTEQDTISLQQSKGQIYLFQQVLDEFGATSPEQAAQLWGKGMLYRNGVFHYVVAAEKLRKELIAAWGRPEESYWNIGTSSPWLDSFEIVDTKILSKQKQKVIIKYFWRSSTGPVDPTTAALTIVKAGEYWQVTDVN
ncbi:MAG: hypothetical protein GX922_02715 [Firmicutes bacterium]|nr:hypothetical protein [Bacillota bacterium]